MKPSDFKPKTSKNRLTCFCLVMLVVVAFVAAIALPTYDVLPEVNATDDAISTLAVPESNSTLLASFDFNDDNDRLKDTSGNDVTAELLGLDALEAEDCFSTDGDNTYLDLNGKNVYLSLDRGLLARMAEVTVEMRMNLQTTGGNQWPFYAAMNANEPSTNGNEYYLSVHLATVNSTTYTAYARRYDGERPGVDAADNCKYGLPVDNLTVDDWYTVKVIFEAGKTTLSIQKDEEEPIVVSTTDLKANIWKCVGDNNILWFGHSAWGQYFDGYIDDIKIWGTPIDDVTDNLEAVEEDHIITQNVADPANTTVNMFDYWTFGGQSGRDYGWGYDKELDDIVDVGINKDHLFMFDGSAVFTNRPGQPGGADGSLGQWNTYGGSNYDGTTNDGYETK